MNDEYTYGQIPKLPTGNYRVTVESAMLKRAATRDPMIEYLFRIMSDGQRERRGRIEQIITPETYERALENLNVCGINCPVSDIAAYLPRARGCELDITISEHTAARTVTFNCRLDSRSLSERGISEEIETLPDGAGVICDEPSIQVEVVSADDGNYGFTFLDELDPCLLIVEGVQ